MSGSDIAEINIEGRSAAANPVDALREALSVLARKLAASGGAPFHLTSMTWVTPDPDIYDPARHALDLCYREVLGGFRPPIAVVEAADRGFVVWAHARIGAVPSSRPWHNLTFPALAREYSPRSQVADMAGLFAQWSRDDAAFRATHTGTEIAYGPGAFEKFDLFRPNGPAAPPLWVFIHGGYWQASDKDQHAQFTAGMLDAGFAVANVNYGLCPDVTLAQIVGQIRAALVFLAQRSGEFGFDRDSIHVAGHSAGGHLAAMAAADPGAPPLRSALLLSGLFDLTPLGLLPVGRLLDLSNAQAVRQLSPITHQPRSGTKIRVVVGGAESDEFKWQSTEMAKIWRAPPPLVVGDANHFELLDGLIAGDLLHCALEMAS